MAEVWMIIFCAQDSSYSLVQKDVEVVCDDSVKRGDKVPFSYAGTMYNGIVKEIGGDRDKLLPILSALNSERPDVAKEPSFHADQPRKAAKRCKDLIKQRLGVSKAPKVQSSKKSHAGASGCNETEDRPTLPKPGRSQKLSSSSDDEPLAKKSVQSFVSDYKTEQYYKKPQVSTVSTPKKLVQVPSSDSSDRNDSYSSDGQPLNEEELKVLRKLSERKKFKDLEAIKNFHISSQQKGLKAAGSGIVKTKPAIKDVKTAGAFKDVTKVQQDGQSSPKSGDGCASDKDSIKKKQEQADASDKDFNLKKQDGQSSPKGLGNCSSSDSEKDTAPETAGVTAKEPRIRKRFACPALPKKVFGGEFFKCKVGDSQIRELKVQNGIYLKKSEMARIKATAKTPTALVRKLLRAIFTEEALESCSVSGRMSCGKGAKNVDVRPALPEDAIVDIIEYAKYRATQKGWDQPKESSLRAAMASFICEERAKRRSRAAVAQ